MMDGTSFGILCMVAVILILILMKVCESNGYQRAMHERVSQVKNAATAIQKSVDRELPRIAVAATPAAPIPAPAPFLTEVERITLKNEIETKEKEIARLSRILESVGRMAAKGSPEPIPAEPKATV